MGILEFLKGAVGQVLTGGKAYKIWVAVLLGMIVIGLLGYANQWNRGLIATNMRDQVTWAFYIGNFTFLVGVAAAAVLLVVPAYVYHWKPIKEVVVLGELLAISALTMCLTFILVDMGRPDRLTHIMPGPGNPNWPQSMLSWDALVLNAYLVLNLVVVLHILYRAYLGKEYAKRFVVPLVLFSIPAAVGIHTVTAFLYAGMAARPYWNAGILAPKFLASAFSSGPAVMIILFQILRKTTTIEIKDEAIQKVAELMAYAIFFNLFLLGAEIFKEYYSRTAHLLFTQYYWEGIGEYRALVPYAWASLTSTVLAFVIFVVPAFRRNWTLLNIGAVLIFAGVYIEKGMGLVIPGMTPDTLGEIYEYRPSATEWMVAIGVFGLGGLVFTTLVNVAVPIMTGKLRSKHAVAPLPGAEAAH
jgi:Ni/Fe-hydrogenase subunit HybB-like protein